MSDAPPPLRWNDLYSEAELYKSALRVYTKPLFQWRKALSVSTDGRNLYDLAGRGLRCLDAMHRSLQRQTFAFRPAVALPYNFNGKRRTLYVAPWEERIVDLLLYRTLNRALHGWFSPNSYAYRDRTYGLDRCQGEIAQLFRSAGGPWYIVKRDITDYFGSVDHSILTRQIAALVDTGDYLLQLLAQRIRFRFHDGEKDCTASVGIPFGTAVACLFANIHLTDLDRDLGRISDVRYFRYADDLLLVARDGENAMRAAHALDSGIAALSLRCKASHSAQLVLGTQSSAGTGFQPAPDFRHLGLQFHANGEVALSRDKCRKIRNLFRFAFRRCARRVRKLALAGERAQALVSVAARTVESGVRNVAIIDYYLKHVSNERQLTELDRWLAEEVLSATFGGHRKGNFARISFAQLRAMGLPSLVHRRRLLLGRRIESAFFIWQTERKARALQGMVARRPRKAATAFSSHPEAAAQRVRASAPVSAATANPPMPVREGGCL